MPDLITVVAAAGLSTRFEGGDKLLALYRGKPLAAHIADTLVDMEIEPRFAICPRDNPARAELFVARGFQIVWNGKPEEGLGHSLALGATRARELAASGMLLCLADMPHVSHEHLERLLAVRKGQAIIATEVAGVRMPPVLFPPSVYSRLAVLTGDRGAKSLLDEARTVEADTGLAHDVDMRCDLDAVSPAVRGPGGASAE
ncbi:MAG: nucleotidyltransferase family protein [Planctomycetales bacterium]|nr:nucleotidyltransferase family protein [Planctomycetales bacterium]